MLEGVGMTATRLYIAGPMIGLPNLNRPAFAAATVQLLAAGYAVESPTDGGQVDGGQWADYMRRGLGQLLTCDGVALLPGWRGSRVACIDAELAGKLDMPVRSVPRWIELAGGE